MVLITPGGKPLQSKPINNAPPSSAGGNGIDLIKDGTDASFMADVMEESMHQPVIIDFWAPWCGPCRQLGPALERAVNDARGRVKLVKINIDENPAYAGQLRVQSIPAVFVIDKGRPVDGFMGAVPESQIRALIEKIAPEGPGGVGEILDAAAAALEAQDWAAAASLFGAVVQAEPENLDGLAGMARVYLAMGQGVEAATLLADLGPEAAKHKGVALVLARLKLAEEAKDALPLELAEAKLAQNPDDLANRFGVALSEVKQGGLEKAIGHLLEIIKTDRTWNNDGARQQLLKIFDAAGPDSELTKQGRRALSSVLFA